MKKNKLFLIFISLVFLFSLKLPKVLGEEYISEEDVATINLDYDEIILLNDQYFVFENEHNVYLYSYNLVKEHEYLISEGHLVKAIYTNDILYLLLDNQIIRYNVALNFIIGKQSLEIHAEDMIINDGYFYIVGEYNNNGKIIKLNTNLDILIQKEYGGTKRETFKKIIYQNMIYVIGEFSCNSTKSCFLMLNEDYPNSIVIFTIDDELDIIKQKYITRLHESLYIKNVNTTLDELNIQISYLNHDYFYKIDSEFEFILNDDVNNVSNLNLIDSYKDEKEFYTFFGSDNLYLGKIKDNNLINLYCFELIDNQINYVLVNNKCLIMSKTERGIKIIYLKEYELDKEEEIKISYYNYSFNLNDHIKASSIFTTLLIRQNNITPYEPYMMENMSGNYQTNIELIAHNEVFYNFKMPFIIEEYTNFIDNGVYNVNKVLCFFGRGFLNDVEIFFGHILQEVGTYQLKIINRDNKIKYYTINIIDGYYKNEEIINQNFDIISSGEYYIEYELEYENVVSEVIINNLPFDNFYQVGNLLRISFDELRTDYQRIIFNRIIFEDDTSLYVNKTYLIKNSKDNPTIKISKKISDDNLHLVYEVKDYDKTFSHLVLNCYLNGKIVSSKIITDSISYKFKSQSFDKIEVNFAYCVDNLLSYENLFSIKEEQDQAISIALNYVDGSINRIEIKTPITDRENIKEITCAKINLTKYYTVNNNDTFIFRIISITILSLVTLILSLMLLKKIRNKKKKSSES